MFYFPLLHLFFLYQILAETTTRKTEQHNSKRPSRGWTVETYPSPSSSDVCFTSSRDNDSVLLICDPDSYLSTSSIENLVSDDYLIPKLEKTNICPDDERKNGKLEIAIAIAEKSDFRSYYSNSRYRSDGENENERIIEASKSFAMTLHDQWGVGKISSCGDTGILIFLSITDRVCYISKGSALNSVLTNSRIDSIIKSMKPHLRSGLYKEAIENGVNEILEKIQSGPPGFFEANSGQLVFILIIASFFGLVTGIEHMKTRQRRSYAEARTRLSQLDRDNALALQGQYKCTSCPICFEPFQNVENSSNSSSSLPSTGIENEESSLGNSENASESVPIMRGHSSSMKGSDDLPLRLLRCGHVFDETCYQTWISTGQGDVTTCPICKQDVGASTTTGTIDPVNNDDSDSSTSSATGTNSLYRRTTTSFLSRNNYNHYRQERLFRLSGLAHRYPQYIRPNQMQRWTDQSYEGRLVQDDNFVRSDPARQQAASSSGRSSSYQSSSSGRSFGGGGSSGGGGGRW